ncbi:LOW QUALITY PROTEIN: putative GTP-binding protein 6 [Rhinatrema bivittatum]|uniref:LOW QUALITY PROTEIN: putative GTP-binding protein 6 n=1 Tax=Rhinatrema bivittatum TaxID=194408 RepID=UPI00112A033C|nr:LOW QUALITY PROTEIN: putative GTP-binding protein 6 [Rhinatrema bivittatum]
MFWGRETSVSEGDALRFFAPGERPLWAPVPRPRGAPRACVSAERLFSSPGAAREWPNAMLRALWKARAAVVVCCRAARAPAITRLPAGGPGRALFTTARAAGKGPGSEKPPWPVEEEEAEEEDDDGGSEEDAELEDEEELWAQHPAAALPPGAQRIFLVHPEVKWGPQKPRLTTAELRLAEAAALVGSLPDWSVAESLILPTRAPGSKLVFGAGSFRALTESVRRSRATGVFLNAERLPAASRRAMEAAWGVRVYDRHALVLHVFRAHARTREAKLQLALAELPLLRSALRDGALGRQGGGGPRSRYVKGAGETFLEVQQRLLRDKELKLRRALRKLEERRRLLRARRQRRELPVVSVVGYTNCGKTTLVKALTGDAGLRPRDRLFATLDVTVHAGLLPCRMPVLYVDTIGFLSQLPHSLIESFSATLRDVAQADLIVHLRDVSHPEAANQKSSVLAALEQLRLPGRLLDSILEVHNKVDLVGRYQPAEPGAFPVSALHGYGLEELKRELESRVLKATEKQVVTIRIDLAGPQLSWLYKEATVQDVCVLPDDGAADVKVIISNSAYSRYRKLFPS